MLKTLDRAALVERLGQELSGLSPEAVEACADRLVATTDVRLEPNVREWLDGQPLSEVWIGRYCLPMVMQIQGRGDFLSALEALSAYAADPAVGENLIWRVRL